MTPPNRPRTASAAARVRMRNVLSPIRRRSRTLARDRLWGASITPPRNATSTTASLPPDCMGGSPLPDPKRAHSSDIFRRCTSLHGEQGHSARLSYRERRWPWRYRGRRRRSRRLLRSSSVGGGDEQRLAARVLDLARPGLLDRADDLVRHRDIVEILGHLVALGVGPVEELEGLGGSGRILRLLVNQDKGRAGDRPSAGPRLVGEDHAEAGRAGPVGICRRGGERLGGR